MKSATKSVDLLLSNGFQYKFPFLRDHEIIPSWKPTDRMPRWSCSLVQLPTVSRSLNGRFFLSLFDVTWGLLNQQLVSNLFICMKGSAVLKNLHDSPLITFNYGVLGKDPRCHID